MAEFDTINLFNPTDSDFTHHFNGEPYTIPAKEQKNFSQFIGFHLAKHLAAKIVDDGFSETDHCDPRKVVVISQHMVYDNPKLRIALFKILRDKSLVQRVIELYPYKGALGDMGEYEKFVKTTEEKLQPKKVDDGKQ